MDRTVPAGAALLLDFIAGFEAPKGYDTVYANKMAQMPKPLTSMTLAEVIADGPRRTKAFGSSACGRFQFMTATLQDLRKEMVLMGSDLFTPDFQDRLGFRLLQRRGYDKFMAGKMTRAAFGLAIAQEWASFPVLEACKGASRSLTRGQSYYAGDGLNKALVKPEAVEAALTRAFATNSVAVALGAPPATSIKTPAAIASPAPANPLVSPAPRRAADPPPPDTGGITKPEPGLFARIAARLRAAYPRKEA